VPERVHKQKPHRDSEVEAVAEDLPPPAEVDDAASKARTEELLDDIDAVLEELGLNSETEAQAFVHNYQQKGGE
jgi:nucleotide-binding universal stress UspA family protein